LTPREHIDERSKDNFVQASTNEVSIIELCLRRCFGEARVNGIYFEIIDEMKERVINHYRASPKFFLNLGEANYFWFSYSNKISNSFSYLFSIPFKYYFK
jgi:hypothetical protein